MLWLELKLAFQHKLGCLCCLSFHLQIPNTPRPHTRLNRGRMNGHMLPYIPHLQQPILSMTSTKESNNHQVRFYFPLTSCAMCACFMNYLSVMQCTCAAYNPCGFLVDSYFNANTKSPLSLPLIWF